MGIHLIRRPNYDAVLHTKLVSDRAISLKNPLSDVLLPDLSGIICVNI